MRLVRVCLSVPCSNISHEKGQRVHFLAHFFTLGVHQGSVTRLVRLSEPPGRGLAKETGYSETHIKDGQCFYIL